MAFSDLKMRFVSEYKGDVKDPVLTTLLQTLDAYHKDIQSQMFLSVYSQRSDQVSDAMFEVLRRHLFGQLFPGPAFAVAQASLREVATASPVRLEPNHYLSLQDAEGSRVLFGPQYGCWVVPSHTNDVTVTASENDLRLGFSILVDNLRDVPGGSISVFTNTIDQFIVERMRSRLPQPLVPERREERPWPLRPEYPGAFTPMDDFFQTPYASRFLEIPFNVLASAERQQGSDMVWLTFPGLGEHAVECERKLTLNTFVVWNFVESEMLAIREDAFRFRIPVSNHTTQETILVRVDDVGTDSPLEYCDAATVLDPGYPFQYTTSVNTRRDDIMLALSPPPQGDVRVRYYQYDLGDTCINIAEGRSFGLYEGIDDRLKSIQSVTPTHRLEALNDKQRIWTYFRSMLGSRNRWLTRDDLRAAVGMFPPFSSRRNIVVAEKIRMAERVGRVPRGFLTPYTEIRVPVREASLLTEPEQTYFEHRLGSYLNDRAVNGNFINVRFISADEV